MSALNLFHATTHDTEGFTYRRPESFVDKDMSRVFKDYFDAKIQDRFGYNIRNALYCFSTVKEFAVENFGNHVYSVSATDKPYKAFYCPNVEDVVYNLRIGRGHLAGSITSTIDYMTYAQINHNTIVSKEIVNKFIIDDDFKSGEDFLKFAKIINDEFESQHGVDKDYGPNHIYNEAVSFLNHRYTIINDYVSAITEITLPFSGDEEVFIVSEELLLTKKETIVIEQPKNKTFV